MFVTIRHDVLSKMLGYISIKCKVQPTLRAAPGCATTTCSALKYSPVKNGHAWSTP